MLPYDTTVESLLIVEIDDHGFVRSCSPAAARFLGWSVGVRLADDLVTRVARGDVTVEAHGDGRSATMGVHQLRAGQGYVLVGVESGLPESLGGVPTPDGAAYRAFFEQAPIGIAHLAADGTVTFENHALRQIVGERPDDAWIGRHIADIGAIDDFLLPLVDRMLSEGQSFAAGEAAFDHPDGSRRTMEIVGSPIRDVDAQVVGGVLTLNDVTDQKLAEEIVKQASRDAQAASKMKSALIATMSHELRTPVGAIAGYASMLGEEIAALATQGLDLPDVIEEFADVIRCRATALQKLVGELVELSQLETGVVSLRKESVDVAALIRDSVERLSGDLLKDTVSVEIETPQSAAIATCDPERAGQICDHLIGNAMKFTDDGNVGVYLGVEDESVVVEIRDTGIGIDPDYLDLVYDPFSQEDHPLSRRFEGAGLGLAIVRRLVDLMGGTISIDSVKGSGTTVRLTLPADAKGQSSASA